MLLKRNTPRGLLRKVSCLSAQANIEATPFTRGVIDAGFEELQRTALKWTYRATLAMSLQLNSNGLQPKSDGLQPKKRWPLT